MSDSQTKPIFLIFESESRVLDGITVLLIGHGYQYEIMESIDQLLKKGCEEHVSGIILGDRLPNSSPQIVIDQLKKSRASRPLPVLLLTRSSFAGSIQVKMPTPFWVFKPIKEADFLARISDMIELADK